MTNDVVHACVVMNQREREVYLDKSAHADEINAHACVSRVEEADL